mgnify:FL=1
MKKKNLRRTLAWMLSSFFLVSCANETVIYVDSSAKTTTADGGIDAPFTTVEEALAQVRQLREDGNRDAVSVVFRSGQYFFDRGFLLDEAMSNLQLKAYPQEMVVFTGGVKIPLNHVRPGKIGDNEVLTADLSDLPVSDWGEIKNVGFLRPSQNSWAELFVNGKPMHLSRWPNEGMIRMGKILDEGAIPRYNDFSNRGAVMAYDSARISGWEFRPDMWMAGYFRWGYADDALRIKEIDKAKKTIHTDGATLYGFYSGYAWNKWYAFNIKEETDAPGEYYLDKQENKLYFISPDEEVESLQISVLEEPFFDLWKARNVSIEHITFECSRAVMLSLCETEEVEIAHCNFRNSGSWAIQVGLGIKPFKDYKHEGLGEPVRGCVGNLQQHIYIDTDFDRKGGKNNRIDHCNFYNLGSGGISLAGGNRKNLIPGNNMVSNCIFHDNNRIERSYRPAIHLTDAGNQVVNCEIYNTPSMAVLMHGNNHLLEYNYIHHACLEVEDQGAFYYGRNPSECGTVLRNNLFAHIPDIYSTCAVYHDDGAGGLTVENNIFYKAGKYAVLMGGGSDNTYKNNLFMNEQIGVHIDNRLQNWGKALIEKDGLFEKRLKEIDYLNDPYASAYPYLKDYIPNDSFPKRNLFDNNMFYNVKQTSDNPKWIVWKDNVEAEKDIRIDSLHIIKSLQSYPDLWQNEWQKIGAFNGK